MEHGFAKATMAEIAARAGASKQTLYNYFGTKDETFVAVMLEKGSEKVASIFQHLDNSLNINSNLLNFGVALLTFILNEEILRFRRVIIAEGGKSKLGELFFEHGPKRVSSTLSAFFANQMRLGALITDDPDSAAIHFQGLIEAGPFQRRLYGARGPVDDAEIQTTVRKAVDAFLGAYGRRT